MKSMEYMRSKASAGQSEVHTTSEKKYQLSIVNHMNLLFSLSCDHIRSDQMLGRVRLFATLYIKMCKHTKL